METAEEYNERPSFTRRSPSPTAPPRPAIGATRDFTRSVSTASEGSVFSGRSSTMSRTSENSSVTSVSRSSSANYGTRTSMAGLERPKRRGYVRPQGTNFAKSAQSRESVLSLGSIAHIQYYFARTGLLDGKGGRLMKKRKDGRETLDLSALDTSFLVPNSGSDADSTYASTASSPELSAQLGGLMVESPLHDYNEDVDQDVSGDEDDNPLHLLPPTASTYIHREKVVEPPPTLNQLRQTLVDALNNATIALEDAKHARTPPASPLPMPRVEPTNPATPDAKNRGWFEVQGMHMLDIMTLAIRAAKMYYTAHEHPERLLAIKSEKEIRGELLYVLEILKRMASRGFANGIRTAERETMDNWVDGVRNMLRREKVLEYEERDLIARWTWLHADGWVGKEIEREYAFLKSMDPEPDTLPPLSLVNDVKDDSQLPTPLLAELKTGLRLVQLHNAAVKKSKRPFGAISTFHTEFNKPYRSAENLRFWVKAAELRWEADVKFDVMGVVNNEDRDVWEGFEEVIWKWCRTVREELSEELKRPRKNSIKI
ncbi:f8ad3ec7-78b0-4b25-aae3-5a818013cb4a-CDS [Sclerotinia trifoliorum]|uniref:F8ad3ec7-78b0-4b25-aae3-5a818013cb4a-CDS n=1 Tax=Sclerotinia trifoliorum TaxID=28548 RepID=A0A8H2VNT1_9HELO|nr:f8ad3ec7-78b0-4b25-aae3-5a818013cb4a-CDS [Sclerotinia trifoliorum]